MLRYSLILLMTLGLLLQHSILTAGSSQGLKVPLPVRHSIVRLGAVPDPVTERGRRLAQTLFDALEKRDKTLVGDVIRQLERAMGEENIGGSYSALHWLATTWAAGPATRPTAGVSAPVLDRAYYDYFLSNDALNLKEYLQRKYGASGYEVRDPEAHVDRRTFLEDYLIFNNPARHRWDATDRVIEIVTELRPQVRRVIDVGAGFGYFSYRFAQALGRDAIVHAVDTQKTYIDYLQDTLTHYGIEGVRPTLSTPSDVSVEAETDLVFISSLYHVLYAWSQPRERDAFIASVRRTLRPGGYLVILDNRDDSGRSLHNSFLKKEFAIAQLHYYGFELLQSEILSPLRYLLVFRQVTPGAAEPPVLAGGSDQPSIQVETSHSLVHIGSLDSFDITPNGIAAARLLLDALEDEDLEAARAAINLYEKIIPQENFGGEYTALQWVAEYLAADDDVKRTMTQDRLSAAFLAYLAEKDFARLRLYLAKKYKLAPAEVTPEEAVDEKTREIGIIRRQALEDFILFNNPRRETWEKSSRILELLPLNQGDTLVDLGSGPGFFSVKFAELVGPEGKVYAMDTKDVHVEYLRTLATEWGLTNLHANVSQTDGFELPESGTADVIFMCSLYHIIYAVSSRSEREGMIQSVIKALKPGGRFVIVDNGPVDQDTLPYHGPYIRKELIESQLSDYGFRLEAAHQIIPQRYLMVFSR